jgi:GNAT superfamily N-acetyltransferase
MRAFEGWADECNHWVVPEHRGRGVGTWLVHHGCEWLRLGGTSRFLAYVAAAGDDPTSVATAARLAYYARFGWVPVNRTRRGWQRRAG